MPDETASTLPGSGSGDKSGVLHTSNDSDTKETGIASPDLGLPESPNKPATMSYLTFVVLMAIGIFLTAMDQTIIFSSYAAIGNELKELQSTSWIATAYMLTLTSFQPLYEKLSDIFGRKTCLLFAYSIFALGNLLCGLSRNMTELILSRAITGIGAGGMSTVVSIIMSDTVPLRSRSTWQGVLNIVFSTGTVAGAPLGGFFSDSIGWRWSFLIQVPIAFLAIVSVSLALHLPKTEYSNNFFAKLKRVDFGGAVTLVFTIFLLLFGLDRGGNISWADHLTIFSLGGFIICFILFSIIEFKLASEPITPKRIVTNRSLFANFLVNFFGTASNMSMIYIVPLYLQAVKGLSASKAGLWLILAVTTGPAGSLAGGLMIQAFGKSSAITVAAYFLMLLGAGLLMLMTGGAIQSLAGLAVGLVAVSIGYGSGITTCLVALIANVAQADQAITTAASYLFRSLGAVLGISIGSTLIQETLRAYLRRSLSGQDIEEIIQRVRESLTYVDKLEPLMQVAVRRGYADATRAALSFSVCMAACAFIASMFIKEKVLIKS